MKGVAITTTVLAVLTAIVSAQSNTAVLKTQILTAEEGMKWQYYQAKTTRVQFIDIQKNLLQMQAQKNDAGVYGLTPALQEQIAALEADRVKQDKKSKDLSAEAKQLGKKKAVINKKGNWYMLSVVFFQIAIMLSSVSALLKRKELWFIGLVFGAGAIGIFVHGFFFVV